MKRKDNRIIIHFDYDCFYASVVEAQQPALKGLPLAIQQKQIVVTCNYVARARGVYKLQLISNARRLCPELVVVLGEDLTRFRDASKDLYNFLRGFSWNNKVERLGFDEVFLDVTDIIDHNVELLNPRDPSNSFFCLCKKDPTRGFQYDASHVAGHVYGEVLWRRTGPEHQNLSLRLKVGSHLAGYLRLQLEEHKGYTSTVGVSTSKLLSKLIGNLHKPKSQTTLMPPYQSLYGEPNNVTVFIDDHEIGKIPGIGFKSAQKLRAHILQREPILQEGLITFNIQDNVKVQQVRMNPSISPQFLEELLGGPGAPKGIGSRVWGLINGIDDTEVLQAREVPRQISIEDSYIRLDTIDEVLKQLHTLARSLIKRMHVDLVEEDAPTDGFALPGVTPPAGFTKRWLARPRTLRLSTRPRPAANPDGSRSRSFNRLSRTAPVPSFLYNFHDSVDALADRLVAETLIPLFRKLHPEPSGWNLSLVNIAVTNMAETGGCSVSASGRDIGSMFKNQDEVLKEWRVEDKDVPPDIIAANGAKGDHYPGKSAVHFVEPIHQMQNTADTGAPDDWDSDDDSSDIPARCPICSAQLPIFAIEAHLRYHEAED